MKKIIVASNNPVKQKAVQAGFSRMFPDETFHVVGVEVASGVSDQPVGDAETLQGAINRVIAAQQQHPQADYWAGLEGGVADINGEMAAFAWVVVRNHLLEGKARTGAFFLPPAVKTLVDDGIELGKADDRVFGTSDSKTKGGAIGLLTGDVLDRAQLYEQGVIMALIPLNHPNLYCSGNLPAAHHLPE